MIDYLKGDLEPLIDICTSIRVARSATLLAELSAESSPLKNCFCLSWQSNIPSLLGLDKLSMLVK
jgi:hypothetical protein